MTLISFETLRKPDGVDAFISARRKTPSDIMSEVASSYKPVANTNGPPQRIISPTHLLMVIPGDLSSVLTT